MVDAERIFRVRIVGEVDEVAAVRVAEVRIGAAWVGRSGGRRVEEEGCDAVGTRGTMRPVPLVGRTA